METIMKTRILRTLIIGTFFPLTIALNGCDILVSDQVPDTINLDPAVANDFLDAYSLKGERLAIDLETLFPDLIFKGVSKEVKEDASYLTENVSRPLLLYNSNNPVPKFLIEFVDPSGDPYIASVNFKETAQAECGAQNFTGASIEKGTKFTVDLLQNEDLCAAKDADRIFSIFVMAINREQNPDNADIGRPYFNKTRLEGLSIGNSSEFENNLSLYTFIPDSSFTGTLKMEYAIAINFDPEAGYDSEDIFNDPSLSEYYSKHEAIITVEK